MWFPIRPTGFEPASHAVRRDSKKKSRASANSATVASESIARPVRHCCFVIGFSFGFLVSGFGFLPGGSEHDDPQPDEGAAAEEDGECGEHAHRLAEQL